MTKAPSIKKLLTIAGVDRRKAKWIRDIIKAPKADLLMAFDGILMTLGESYPRTTEWYRRCYSEPSEHEIRAHILNEVLENYGVEAVFRDGNIVAEYCNNGDTYENTLVFYRGRWQVMCWGDIAEKHLP